jgi:hypothetical protein
MAMSKMELVNVNSVTLFSKYCVSPPDKKEKKNE